MLQTDSMPAASCHHFTNMPQTDTAQTTMPQTDKVLAASGHNLTNMPQTYTAQTNMPQTDRALAPSGHHLTHCSHMPKTGNFVCKKTPFWLITAGLWMLPQAYVCMEWILVFCKALRTHNLPFSLLPLQCQNILVHLAIYYTKAFIPPEIESGLL